MTRRIIAITLAALVLSSCASSGAQGPAPKAARVFGAEQILPYVHVDGFGTETDSPAWIAWEFEAQAYVKYQIAYTSCTCRQESVNVRSLLYVEVTKEGPASRIKHLGFNYWGDSPVMPSGITREEIEKGFMPKLPGLTRATLETVDALSGATVTTVNLKQISKALLDYHVTHYPKDSGIKVDIGVDATTAATE